MRSGNLEREDSDVSASSAKDARPATAPSTPADDDEACRTEPAPTRRAQVCHRWRCEARVAVAPARWSGDPSACHAGELDADAAERALRMLNVHRFLAGVAPVDVEPTWTDAAQQCALVAHANAKLSHTPPSDWRCWSDLAAATSAVSLIANRSAPPAIAAFVEDPGNEPTMVHRRWLLSEELERIGIGSTDRYSCVVVDGRGLGPAAESGGVKPTSANVGGADDDQEPEPAARGWVAWPPPGPVPMDVFTSERLDEMGWTIQSSTDDLDRATVTVSSEGKALAVRIERLAPMLGSRSAIRFVPDGWKTEPERSYVVRVAGERSFEFTVEPTACP